MRLFSGLMAAAIGLVLATSAFAAEPVFHDSFANLDQWSKSEGVDPSLAKLKQGETAMPCMVVGNGVAKAELPDVVDESFTLSFRALNCDFERGLWLGVFNTEGTQGYAVAWDSSKEAFASGQGFVSIAKFDLTKPVTWAGQLGKLLTEPTPSGQKAVNNWPVLISLSWDKATGTLTLKVDNAVKGRAVDKSFKSFARLYARGNERSVFADVKLTLKPSAGPATRPASDR